MKLVSVIILNWNGKELLLDCVDSALKQTYQPIELIVVDNASTDGSLALLKERYPDLRTVENQTNLGFSKSMNKGIGECKGDYIMPLNYDVILESNFVEEMVKSAEMRDEIGSVSGKLLRFNREGGRSIIDSTGHILFRNRLSVNRGESEVDDGQYEEVEFVFGTCGAAPLYKREMLEDVKVDGEYYDEDFFAFWEDVDLDWRAQLRGWKCIYTPRAVAYHQRGGPTIRRSKIVELHNYKNRYLTMLKNDDPRGLLRVLPQLLFTELLKGGALLVRCPWALRGWVDVLRLLPSSLAKRRVVQRGRVIGRPEMEKWFEKFDYWRWIKRHLR